MTTEQINGFSTLKVSWGDVVPQLFLPTEASAPASCNEWEETGPPLQAPTEEPLSSESLMASLWSSLLLLTPVAVQC